MKSNRLKNVDELCQVFKTIGNKNRLGIVMLLAKGELSVGKIEFALDIKQPNLSHELKKLRDLGLVATRRESRVIYYRLANDEVAGLIKGLVWLTSADSLNGEIEIETSLPFIDVSGFSSVSAPPHAGSASSQAKECGDFPVIRH